MNEATFGRTRLQLLHGDITRVGADAIVNAANEELWPGGGVSGAIHRAAGPTLFEECRRIGYTPTGQAAITGGGRLLARHVIHAVGPIWEGGHHGEPELLASAYRASLELADTHGLRSIAFPSISTGTYGYPIARAARVALSAVRDHLERGSGLTDVIFVLYTAADLAVYAAALNELMTETS